MLITQSVAYVVDKVTAIDIACLGSDSYAPTTFLLGKNRVKKIF